MPSLTHVLEIVQSEYQTVADRALKLLLAMAVRPPGPFHALNLTLFQANIHAPLGAALPELY